MPNNLLLSQGYGRTVATPFSCFSGTSGPLSCDPINGRMGGAILLPPQPTGQQIDSIWGGITGNMNLFNQGTCGIRVVVFSVKWTIEAATKFLTAATLGWLATFTSQNPGPGSAITIPDPATGLPNPFLTILQVPYYPGAGLRCLADKMQGRGSSHFYQQLTGGSRRGGGILIPPGETGIVLGLGLMQYTADAPQPGAIVMAPVVSVTAYGGPLAPGDVANASNTDAGVVTARAVPRAGAPLSIPVGS